MQYNNQLMWNILPSNHSVIKLSWNHNQRQFVFRSLTTKHCFFKPSFNLSLPLSNGQNIVWHHPDTSLLRLVPFQEETVSALLFSFCQGALSYGSSLVTFPETTKHPDDKFFSLRLAQGREKPHDNSQALPRARQPTGAGAIIRANQPLKCCEHHEHAAAAEC